MPGFIDKNAPKLGPLCGMSDIRIQRLVDGDASREHREALRVINLDAQERREAGERLVGVRQAASEVRGKAEGEGGVEAAIVGKAKATDLVTPELPGPRRRQKERREREAELADLLVQIPQVRGLDVDRGPDIRGQGVGAKEPRLGGHTGVGHRIERMTVATGEESGTVGLAWCQRIEEGFGAKENIKALLLLRGQRVVQVANRVRGVHHLQDEAGERLHIGLGDRAVASEEAGEGNIKRLAQFIAVCRRSKWSKHRTNSPLLALLAMAGSSAARKISSACSQAFC